VVTHCHCVHCRRTSAAPFVTWAEFKREDFAYTKGTPVEYSTRPAVIRACCPKCGTQLTYRREDAPDSLDVTVCSFDEPERLEPQDHVWSDRRLPWVQLDDGLPQYRRARES